jgi:fructose-1,6-bisphosphatase/inositol monophosphatase family enzyme
MQGGENTNVITTLLASAGGSIIMYVITRIFSKTEDSASKEYVDATRDKLEAKIEKKADKDSVDKIDKKLDAIYMLLLEQRPQSPQK